MDGTIHRGAGAHPATRWLAAALTLPLTCTAQGGWHGELEGRLQVDDLRSEGPAIRLEQWADLLWRDEERRENATIRFALREGPDGPEGHIYQLAWSVERGRDRLTAGRFDQIDGSGFYALDGLRLKLRGERSEWRLFTGVPQRIDGLTGLSGGFLAGMEWRRPVAHLIDLLPGERLDTRLGLSRQWNGGATATRLTWEAVTADPEPPTVSGLQYLALAGSVRLDEWRMDNLTAGARIGLQEGVMQIAIDHYRPPEERVDFRDRFYQAYARVGQERLVAAWHHPESGAGGVRLEGRLVRREGGGTGAGAAVEKGGALPDEWRWHLRADHLGFGDESVTSLYATLDRPLDSHTELRAEGVVQRRESVTSGTDPLLGIALHLRRRLRAGLTVALSAELIGGAEGGDEYRLLLTIRRPLSAGGARTEP
ncbi:MAG TPA: hypothetical protein ENK54_09560 [Thiotrichales bacterium]|nr:hypothetical protein [Thiotrichales bacterium]